MDTCRVPGCEKTKRTLGLCPGHVSRWYRYGDVQETKPLREYRWRNMRPVLSSDARPELEPQR